VGLAPKHAGDVPVVFEFDDLDTAVRGHRSSSPARRSIDVAGRDAVEAATRSALESSVQADGRLHQANVFRYVIASPD
jgi:hypothetical protein